MGWSHQYGRLWLHLCIADALSSPGFDISGAAIFGGGYFGGGVGWGGVGGRGPERLFSRFYGI